MCTLKQSIFHCCPEQHDEQEKRQKIEAEKLKKFREKVLNFSFLMIINIVLFQFVCCDKYDFQIEEKVNKFLKDDKAKDFTFPPMDQVCRSIVYVSHSKISLKIFSHF